MLKNLCQKFINLKEAKTMKRFLATIVVAAACLSSCATIRDNSDTLANSSSEAEIETETINYHYVFDNYEEKEPFYPDVSLDAVSSYDVKCIATIEQYQPINNPDDIAVVSDIIKWDVYFYVSENNDFGTILVNNIAKTPIEFKGFMLGSITDNGVCMVNRDAIINVYNVDNYYKIEIG